jgi:hypothetical protein
MLGSSCRAVSGASVFALALAACAVSSSDKGNTESAPPPAEGPAPGLQDPAKAPPGPDLVYTHDTTSLYRLDPSDPKAGLTKVGDFDCITAAATPPEGMASSMTDIAVDRDGRLFGVASQLVFLDMKVNGGKVECKAAAKTLTAGGANADKVKFFGASFAPAGTLDPQRETLLVGNTDGELYQVDTQTGALALVGTFGKVPNDDGNGHTFKYPGRTWELSGDVVFVENAGHPVGFATVRDCKAPPSTSSCNSVDTLIEIDPMKLSAAAPGVVTRSVRGQIVKGSGCTDSTGGAYGNMFGIAAAGKDIFGFSREGLIVRIDNDKGFACAVSDFRGSFVDPNKGFNGAGVTTRVQIVQPPPK